MKIRNASELSEMLDKASAWRKKEIATLRILIKTQKKPYEREMLRRIAIPILYGHWEGFAKQAATSYLDLVIRQRRPYRELKSNFMAIAIRGKIREAEPSRRISPHITLVDTILDKLDTKINFNSRQIIDTESNLSSGVLKNIFSTIGIPYDSILEGKELLIDGSLLKNRNGIAHGEYIQIDFDTYNQLHQLVVELIDHMKNVIESQARTQAYLSPQPDPEQTATTKRVIRDAP